VPVSRPALMQSPLAIVMLSRGLVFLIRRINGGRDSRGQLFRPVLGILVTVWPIILAIFLYGWFGMDLSLAVITALLSVLVVYRPSWKIVGQSLRKGLSYKLLILILGILSFQTVLEGSGAVASLQQLSLDYHLPDKLIIVLVCFVSGILTGMFAAFVALGYSLLGTFLYQPHPVPANILLAFLSGYLGMMLSPAHLCLVLTNEYFGSSLGQVYRRLVVPVLLLGLAGYLLVISGWPEWVMTVVE